MMRFAAPLAVALAAVGLCAAVKEKSVSVAFLPTKQKIGGYVFTTPKGVGWRGTHSVSDRTGGEMREYHYDLGGQVRSVSVLHMRPDKDVSNADAVIAWLDEPAMRFGKVKRGDQVCVTLNYDGVSPVRLDDHGKVADFDRSARRWEIYCPSLTKPGWLVSLEIKEVGLKGPSAQFEKTARKMIDDLRPA